MRKHSVPLAQALTTSSTRVLITCLLYTVHTVLNCAISGFKIVLMRQFCKVSQEQQEQQQEQEQQQQQQQQQEQLTNS